MHIAAMICPCPVTAMPADVSPSPLDAKPRKEHNRMSSWIERVMGGRVE
jgi:hypothetical protein